jgi:acetyl esterase
MIGRMYLERGQPVTVLARWNGKGPRNVLIRRADTTLVVRPFRGLRKIPDLTDVAGPREHPKGAARND